MDCPCLIDESSTFWEEPVEAFYALSAGALGVDVLYATDSAQEVMYSWVVPGFAGPTTEYTAAANHLILDSVVGDDGDLYVIEVDTGAAPDVYTVRRVLPSTTTLTSFTPGTTIGNLTWTASGTLVLVDEDGNLISIDPATGTPTTLAATTDIVKVVPTLDGALWCYLQPAVGNDFIERRDASGTVTLTLAEETPGGGLLPCPQDTDTIVAYLSEVQPQIIQTDGSYADYGCESAPALNGFARLWSPDQSLIWTVSIEQASSPGPGILHVWDWTNPCALAGGSRWGSVGWPS